MSRNRASAKKAGALHEKRTAEYLAAKVDDRIERRTKRGAKDCGDISGLRTPWNDRMVVECKNTSRLEVGKWLQEVERERINDGAYIGVVVFKRHGIADPAQQPVLMTLENFVKLLDGAADAE